MRSEKTNLMLAVLRCLRPFHVPQIYESAMDSATSVDDAALSRSRPMLTTLAKQAEMFTSQVPIFSHGSRMPFHSSLTNIFLLLMILLLHQTFPTEGASLKLQEYSVRSVNFSISRSDHINPKNLSELIEFSPLDPLEIENSTLLNEKVKQQSHPKIMTFKVKTHVMVENKESPNKTREYHDLDGKNTQLKMGHVSEDPLSDIEYLDPENDESIWGAANPFKWKFRSRVARMKSLKYENNSGGEISKSIELSLNSDDSKENKIDDKKLSATGRQFLFHPYIPYGKDIPPDEKISFHDILPVKMAKFIKSMVEEAPWEQMFMKMVRMIVDQFVDKIIEKMFAEKEHDHLKRRSFDVFLSPSWPLPTFQTPILRLKRSINSKNIPDQEESSFTIPPPKRLPQDTVLKGKKSPEERMTWLDHFLDFVFPNSKSNMSDEGDSFERLRKRDTSNVHVFRTLVNFFLNTFEKSSGLLTDAKDILRYKMLKEFLPYLYQKRYAISDASGSKNALDRMKMSHRKLSDMYIKRNDVLNDIPTRSERHKRSARSHSHKDENEEDNRLWHSSSQKVRPVHQKHRDECSLRKACNAGRLLSRLPSVHDVTLQLKSYGNEPHWEALIWGMKKKRCSRIFCKRQRSPKGSRHTWSSDREERKGRRVELVTAFPADESEETDNSTF